MFYKEISEQAGPGSAFLEHLEAQGLKISTKHGGGKGEGQLQDVTGLPKKTLDTSLIASLVVKWKFGKTSKSLKILWKQLQVGEN